LSAAYTAKDFHRKFLASGLEFLLTASTLIQLPKDSIGNFLPALVLYWMDVVK
jgi:hypothetical protein